MGEIWAGRSMPPIGVAPAALLTAAGVSALLSRPLHV